MKKTEWTMETLDNQSAFMRNIASNTTTKHKNTTTEEVLDKIRAEIQELPIQFTCAHEMQKWALEIIDKYKGESEPQESEG